MITSLQNDPIQNAIYNGIKKSIEVCIENDCFAAVTILVYSGIDTMAFLSMPPDQVEVNRNDFIKWCDKYLRLTGSNQIQGIEYYSARCSVLHSYGVESKLTRDGKARKIGYMDRANPEILYDPKIDPTFILLSIEALSKAFFRGIDQFLIDACAKPETKAIIESRLPKILIQFPAKQS